MSKKNRGNNLPQVKESAPAAEEASKWDSGLKVTRSCGLCEGQKQSIVLSRIVYERILRLNAEVKSLSVEWLGYLLGERVLNEVFVNDIVVPPQEVTGASATVTEEFANANLVGTIHLHPFSNGSSFFSSTDHDHIGQNYDVMIVTDLSGGMKGSARVNLECGAVMRADATVYIERTEDPGMGDFIDSALLNIKKHTYATTVYNTKSTKDETLYVGSIQIYCGFCRKKLIQDEPTGIINGVEYCSPCFSKKAAEKDKEYMGKECHDCNQWHVWKEFHWVEGIARCDTCFNKWLKEGGESVIPPRNCSTDVP